MHTLTKLLTFIILTVTSSLTYAEWTPFILENNHITIDVEINGHATKAMLDSGSNMNMIDKRLIAKVGEDFKKTDKVRIKGVNGSERVQLYNNIPVKMFGGEFLLDNIAEGNLGDYGMILSADFFSNVIVQIDYPNSRIQLFSRKDVDMDKFENVPMRKARSTGLPAIQVKINGKRVWLTLDTGNAGPIHLKRSTAVDNDWLTESTPVEKHQVSGLYKTIDVEQFNVDTVKIGPYELESVPIQVPDENANTNIGENDDEVSTQNNSRISRGIRTKGIIGYDILKHFTVTVDLDDYQMHIIAD